MLSTNKNTGAPRGLKGLLDRLYKTFDAAFLSSDPLWFVHGFERDEDREIVGLIASSLAYGRVEGIKNSIGKCLDVMGKNPYDFTLSLRPQKALRRFAGFVHRFNTGEDICALLFIAQKMIKEKGSINGFFLKGFSPEDENVKNALSAFSDNALALYDSSSGVYCAGGKGALPQKAGVRFFFPNPRDGSACKRMNLYLRWMVRRGDSLDLGIWKGIPPSKLVMPLDTHIARIAKNIGLTALSSPGWSMAEDITRSLKRLDPKDPVKYDFALCRLGILDKCPKTIDLRKCEGCLIKKICVI